MRTIIKDLAKPGNARTALELMRSKMIESDPDLGDGLYRAIVERHRLRDKGAAVSQVKAALLEMYTVIETGRKPAQASDDGIDDSDIPEELGGAYVSGAKS
jgi:hypothetical protein